MKYGCPAAFYNARHSIFTKHDLEDVEPRQFQRALRILWIEDICVLTPQAKGRVERTFLRPKTGHFYFALTGFDLGLKT
ncbi:MAG: hypothetical protein LBS31_12460 [Candidatus Adiutrix sp.]|jgi:hypothetical protein|nr:hypothetical protein [Candidatus Adiutrix sp.]